MPRAAPPFRADQVGGLLRPPELLQARDDLSAGRISSTAEGNLVTREQQGAKLRRIVEVAREVWG